MSWTLEPTLRKQVARIAFFQSSPYTKGYKTTKADHEIRLCCFVTSDNYYLFPTLNSTTLV